MATATKRPKAERVDMDEIEASGVRTARVTLRGTAPYSPSRAFQSVKAKKEDHDEFDEKHWRERAHVNDAHQVVIPTQSFYLAVLSTAMLLGEKIPGRGNKTWTEAFTTGIYCMTPEQDDRALVRDAQGKPHAIDQVKCEKLYLPADGEPAFRSRGASKRVWRRFPVIPLGWSVELEFTVINATITREVFFRHLRDAGLYTGVGRFRPQSRGLYGRFVVERAEWSEG